MMLIFLCLHEMSQIIAGDIEIKSLIKFEKLVVYLVFPNCLFQMCGFLAHFNCKFLNIATRHGHQPSSPRQIFHLLKTSFSEQISGLLTMQHVLDIMPRTNQNSTMFSIMS